MTPHRTFKSEAFEAIHSSAEALFAVGGMTEETLREFNKSCIAGMRHPEQPFKPANEYVLGFAFSADGTSVLLINKTKPEWQAGKLNGVGGKIEEFDWCIAEAMRREFQEETGIETALEQWSLFAQHQNPAQHHLDDRAYALYVFSTVLTPEQMEELAAPTPEQPEWIELSDLANLLNRGVPGSFMYVAMALNHMDRPFSSMTIETPDWMTDES